MCVRILAVLAAGPDEMHTSTAIAEELDESAVMVRRTFLLLQKAGLIVQRKGPSGGARLKVSAKSIGLGDVYAAAETEWMAREERKSSPLDALLRSVRKDAVTAMNDTTLSQVVKRMRKAR